MSVNHPVYGSGTIRATRYKGLERQVEFADGALRWVRADELNELASEEIRTPVAQLAGYSPERFRARRMIESFRLGIVPYDCIQDFTFGREQETRELADWLVDPAVSTRLVLGEYGAGKTHLLQYAYGQALSAGYAVSRLTIDPDESPFSRPKRIYASITRDFRFPFGSENRLGDFREFLETCFQQGAFQDHVYFKHLMESLGEEELWEWVSAGYHEIRPVNPVVNRRIKKFPALYDYQTAANIYTYLISSLGWAAKTVFGLKGLLLVFDEAESVDSYYHSYQPAFSRNFLSALIRSANNDESLTGDPRRTGLTYCKTGIVARLPFLYRAPSSLKLLFSSTPGYTWDTLPELLNAPSTELQSLDDQALIPVFDQLCEVYDRAFRFTCKGLSFERLAERLPAFGASTRRFVKAGVEALDLARTHPGAAIQDLFEARVPGYRRIPQLLPNAWTPFFSRFGSVRPVQVATIPKILEGTNVVISAPTASGKTEAVVAPVAQRLVTEKWPGLSVVYIVPTRALGNDMFERVGGCLQEMGISARLRHSDSPGLPKKRLPNFLITTPESLDSLICRQTEAIRDIRTLILDEIHLIDGTCRGDQLMILISRLRKLAHDPDFSVHVLSATLQSPSSVGVRYAGDFEVVSVEGQRTVNLMTVQSLDQVHSLSMQRQYKKILCFCNTRQKTEEVADAMRQLWNPYPVVVHHGSLGKSVREEAERVMKHNSVAVCVATSSLEIGIDIGDIDLVVLAEVPPDFAAFTQRIGRGKRRSDCIDVCAICADGEEFLYQGMAQAVDEGDFGLDDIESVDLSPVVQQFFSYLWQYRKAPGVSESELVELASPLCCEEDALLILAHLEVEGWLERRHGDLWAPAARLVDRGDRGYIHVNIRVGRDQRVVDAETGKEIGQVSSTCEEFFVLGNRQYKTLSADKKKRKVRLEPGMLAPAKFRYRLPVGAYYFYLPEELQLVKWWWEM